MMDFVDNESVPTIQCSRCCEWHHRPCVIGLKFTDQCFTCPDCGPGIFEESEAALAVDLLTFPGQRLVLSNEIFPLTIPVKEKNPDDQDEEQVIAKQKVVMHPNTSSKTAGSGVAASGTVPSSATFPEQQTRAPTPAPVPVPIAIEPISPESEVFTPFRHLTTKRSRALSMVSIEAQDGTEVVSLFFRKKHKIGC